MLIFKQMINYFVSLLYQQTFTSNYPIPYSLILLFFLNLLNASDPVKVSTSPSPQQVYCYNIQGTIKSPFIIRDRVFIAIQLVYDPNPKLHLQNLLDKTISDISYLKTGSLESESQAENLQQVIYLECSRDQHLKRGGKEDRAREEARQRCGFRRKSSLTWTHEEL